MILTAALLVLLGLGLFVGGVLTGATALYWGCVAVCVAAAVLLVLARRRIFAEAAGGAPAASTAASTAASSAVSATATGERPAAAATSRGATPDPSADAAPASEAGSTGTSPATGERAAVPAEPAAPPVDAPDPAVEDVEVTDLLIVVDLKDEVLVVDEHPRYHLEGCPYLRGRTTIPLPIDEARSDGFTPCAACEPDRNLAQRARARKAGRGS